MEGEPQASTDGLQHTERALSQVLHRCLRGMKCPQIHATRTRLSLCTTRMSTHIRGTSPKSKRVFTKIISEQGNICKTHTSGFSQRHDKGTCLLMNCFCRKTPCPLHLPLTSSISSSLERCQRVRPMSGDGSGRRPNMSHNRLQFRFSRWRQPVYRVCEAGRADEGAH